MGKKPDFLLGDAAGIQPSSQFLRSVSASSVGKRSCKTNEMAYSGYFFQGFSAVCANVFNRFLSLEFKQIAK